MALALALVAALASVSTTFALDDEKEQAKNERGEREKNEREARKRDGRAQRAKWPMIGHGPRNTRNQPFERKIEPVHARHLGPQWVATAAAAASATPAASN